MQRGTFLVALATVSLLWMADFANAEWSYIGGGSLEGTYGLGAEMTFRASGSLAAAEQVFVFVESTKCEGSPQREEAAPTGRELTPREGETIGPGAYSEVYTWKVAAVHELSGVCMYLGWYALSPEHWTVLGSNLCEQVPGSNIEPEGHKRCEVPRVSEEQLRAIVEAEIPALVEAQNKAAIEASRRRNEAAAREAAEQRAKREEASRCKVPSLRGHTMRGSRTLLSGAHCKLGKVRVRAGGRGTLRVIAQSPARDTKLAPGGRVSVTLGRAKPRP